MSRIELNSVLLDLSRRYAQTARQVLGENLVSVVLFGSVARGEAGPTSDIDLLVVLEDAPRGAFARHALLEPVRRYLAPEIERLWNRAVYTDFTEVVLAKDEASRSRWLYLDILEDGIALHDSDGFFSRVLDSLRRKLESLGARRLSLGNVRWWDLKPDFRPGDVIDI